MMGLRTACRFGVTQGELTLQLEGSFLGASRDADPETDTDTGDAGAADSDDADGDRALARGAAVIAPPHPLYGGTLDNPVVIAIAKGFERAGLASLAFNYRGVDHSEGEATDALDAAVADYQAALAELTRRAPAPYFAAGYSFGAGSALLSARDDKQLKALLLVAPPVGMLRAEDLRAFPGRIVVLVGDDDEYAPLPQLERILAARSDITLEVLSGADHFFHYGGLPELPELVQRHAASFV